MRAALIHKLLVRMVCTMAYFNLHGVPGIGCLRKQGIKVGRPTTPKLLHKLLRGGLLTATQVIGLDVGTHDSHGSRPWR